MGRATDDDEGLFAPDDVGLEPLPAVDLHAQAIESARRELSETVDRLRRLHRLTLADLFAVLSEESLEWATMAQGLEAQRPATKIRGTL